MNRLLATLLLAWAAAVAAKESPPPGDEFTAALKAAVEKSKAGAYARARLINESAGRLATLTAALKDSDDDVRVSAAWAMRHCGDKARAVGPLTAALRDENFSVARAAAVSLKQFDAIEEPLRKLMAEKDSSLRWRGLINVDYMVLPALMGDVARLAATDPADFIRADAAWTLRHGTGPAVAEALVKCLADRCARVRAKARSSLLRGRVSAEVKRRGSPVRRSVLAKLVGILSSHRGQREATAAAVEVLTELVVTPIGADPARWRKLLASQEGGK